MSRTASKIFLGTILLIVVVCLGFIVAMVWTPLPTWLANRIVDSYLEDALNMDIHIGDVGGNLVSTFSIENIQLNDREGDLRGHIGALSLEYDWRDLVRRRWHLQKLYFEQPVIHLPSTNGVVSPAGVDSSAMTWSIPPLPSIEVQNLKILGGRIVSPSGVVVDSLLMRFSLQSADRHIQAKIPRCVLRLPQRNLLLGMSCEQIIVSPEGILISHLDAHTPSSHLNLSGHMIPIPVLSCSLDVRADTLSLDDLALATALKNVPSGRLQIQGQVQGADRSWWGRVQMQGTVADHRLDLLKALVYWEAENLTVSELVLQSPGVDLKGRGQLRLGSHPPGFEADMNLRAVNLSAVLPQAPATRVNGRMMVSGTGLEPQFIQATGQVDLHSTTVAGHLFERIRGQVQYQQGSITIPQGLEVEGQGFQLFLTGSMDARQQLNAQARAEITQLGQFFTGHTLSGSLQAQFHAQGPLKDPHVAGQMYLSGLKRDGQRVDRARGSFGISGVLSREEGFFALRFFGGQAGGLALEEGRVRGRMQAETIFVDSLFLQGPQGALAAVAEADIVENGIDVRIDPLHGHYLGSVFATTAPLRLSYRSGQFHLQQAELSWEGGQLEAQGSFGPESKIRGEAQLRHLPLDALARFLPPEHQLTGFFSGHLTVDGSVDDPLGEVSVIWQDGRFDQVDIDRVEADLAYRHGQLTVNNLEVRRGDTHFHAQGFLPLDLTAGGLVSDQPWDLSLMGEGTEVGFLPLLIKDVERLEGSFSIEFQASGTPSEPQYSGFFKLQNGLFKLTAMGNTVQNLSAQVHLDGQYLVIDGIRGVTPLVERNLFKRIWSWFFPSRRRGRLEAFGRINLARTAFDVTAKGSRFYIDYLEEQVEAESDFNLRITGVKRPQLSGQLTVSRALVSRPMATTPRVASDTGPPPFDMDLTVQLPKNCWVRNEAVEVELRGQMQVLQRQEGLGLLGDLETVRGSYFFYGNDFRIDRGQVTFDDPEDINPLLDVQAWTQVDRERIDLAISGRMRSPTITLTSASGYGEGDIIALLALHQSSTGLDTVGTGEVVTTQAGSFFGSYLREALNRKASRLLGVDTFKITPDSDRRLDLSRAELTVGTYLSSQVYVEYSRRLSQESGEQVGVEYSLTRNLSLDGKRDRNGLYRMGLNVRWEY